MDIDRTPPPKPTPEFVSDYCRQVEAMLSAQEWNIEITLRDTPLGPLIGSVNGNVTEVEYSWIKSFIVRLRSSDILELPLPPRFSLLAKPITPGEIWHDAHEIQKKVYEMQKSAQDDRYWKLWDHQPNRQL